MINSLQLLNSKNPENAKSKALEFIGNTVLFKNQIIPIFNAHPPDTKYCGCGTTFEPKFNFETLGWVFPGFCQGCKDKEFEIKRNRVTRTWLEMKKNTIYAILKKCNAPNRYISNDRQGFIMADKSQFPKMQEYIDKILDNGSLFVFGSRGNGKTLFAIAALKEFILATQLEFKDNTTMDTVRYRLPLFINTLELLNNIMGTFKEDSRHTTEQIINKYTETPLLIIDDFGVGKISDFVIQTFYLIINKRYENGMSCIFTSNYSLNDIANIYNKQSDQSGDRIISRIAGMVGKQCVIQFPDGDWRLKQ